MAQTMKLMVEESKNHGYQFPLNSVTLDGLQTGAIMRIAAATELMAKNHQQLIDERDYYKNRCEEQNRWIDRLRFQIRGLKGALTRAKRKKQ